MKLAVVIAPESAGSLAFTVWRGFESSIFKASEYGYHGVELALKSTSDVNPDNLSKWLKKNNIEVSCINTGQVFADLGLYFTNPDLEIRRKVIDVFRRFIHLAENFGGFVNVGRARGFIADNQSKREAEKICINTIQCICDIGEKYNVSIIIEPINRYETNFINSLDEGTEFLSKINASNVGLMADVFHMNIEDDRIGDSLIRNAKMIHYIHLADSNRKAPGQGHIDFDEVFKGLKKAGFNGWGSVEVLPKPDPDIAARQAAEFILPMIEAYNKS